MVTAIRGDHFFDNMLDDINYSKGSFAGKLYPFKVRVGVIKIRPPRHEFFNFVRDMGLGDIKRILEKKSLRTDSLTFVFPERWMSVQEIYAFMSCLLENPDISKIKQVDILTSSPILISNFSSEQMRILTWEDDSKYEK